MMDWDFKPVTLDNILESMDVDSWTFDGLEDDILDFLN